MAPLSRRNRCIISRVIGSETILYDPRNESIHVLNPAAAVIWELCDGEHNVEAITLGLSRAFASAERANLHMDVVEALRTFHDLGLVENGSAEATHTRNREEL